MAAFRYQAINAQGKLIKGAMEGDTERQIRSQLRQQQLKPVRVEKVAAGTTSQNQESDSSSKTFSTRVGVKDLTLLTRQIASLVQSGMPLAETLQVVAKQTRKDKVRDIVLHVRSRVLEGRSLSQGLSDFPRVFDSMYCAMVNAGEQAGFLGPVLERLSEYTEKTHEARQRLSSAMVYPAMLLVVCIAVVIILMVSVVPELTSAFARGKQELPLPTQWLITISDFIRDYGLFCLGFFVLAIVGFRWWLKGEANRKKWHRFKLKLPIVKHIVTQADSTRFASTLSMLIMSGVPLLHSLRISNQTMSNLFLKEKAEQAAIAVKEGASLNKALDRAEVFPPLMVQMAASGEANGTLAEQLSYSANSQQKELDAQIATALGLVQPLIVIVMALVIGFIMLSIVLAITDISNAI